MTIKIVTDSTCDLPLEVIGKYDITVIPSYINFPDRSYLDGIELSRQDFYNRLSQFDALPTTSAPALGTFATAFSALRDRGANQVLSIHVSSTLSGIFNIASLAAESVENLVVKTFDAGNLSLGTGLVVETAAKLAQAGFSIDEILGKIKNLAARTYSFAALDTLKFLQRSGRVSRLVAGFGSLLQIKPVVCINRHQVKMEITRTNKGAFTHLIQMLKNFCPIESIALVHTNAPEKAELLREQSMDLTALVKDAYSMNVSPVIGTHLGPGAVGFVVVTDQASS